MNCYNWIVDEENQLKRIDKYISEQNADLSRNYIQQLIDEENILVNGKKVKNNYKVKVNDEIICNLPEVKELEAIAQEMDLDIIFEDSDVIVLNKPKNIVVHPGVGNPDNTLVNGVLFHCKDLSGINGVLRPGVVHRIDKDTTGLLVMCKNDKAHESLSQQLSNKTASRKYIALVHGVMTHEYGTIDAPIGRDKKDRQKMTVTSSNSKNAVTHFKVLKRFKDFTLIECSLETGRTHQIRVHMQYIKFPIVGDYSYSIRKTMDTNGQMLHAYELSFVHPSTLEEVTFNAPLPSAFEEVLNSLEEDDEWK